MPRGRVIMHIADGELREGPPRKDARWDYHGFVLPEDMLWVEQQRIAEYTRKTPLTSVSIYDSVKKFSMVG